MEIIDCPICRCLEYEQYTTAFDIKISKQEFFIVKCKKCGFVYTNPRPSFDEISKYYGKDYYSYQEVPIKNCNLVKNSAKKHLYIGCGYGRYLIHKTSEGFESYGVEIDNETIRKTQEKGLKVLHINEFFGFFPNEYFDLISLNQSMEHIHQLRKIMSELYRILKTRQGRLIINVPNLESYDSKL